MSDIAVTPANVGPVFEDSRIRSVLSGYAAQGGDPIYVDANGLAQKCSSAAANTSQFAGIALPRMNSGYAAGVGQACEIVEQGEVEGFSLGSVAYWAPVYLADDGGISATPGTHSAQIGRVVPTTERDASGNPKKLLQVFSPWNSQVS